MESVIVKIRKWGPHPCSESTVSKKF